MPPAGERSLLVPLAVALGIALLALLIDFYTYANGFNGPPIRSDGFGYYIYLPALLLHGDPLFQFLSHTQLWDIYGPITDLSGQGLTPLPGGGYADKYPVGTALLQLPFFLVALLYERLTGADSAGLGGPFQFGNAVSAACYLAAGSFVLFRLAHRRSGQGGALFLVALAVLGTNLLNYGSYDGAFSHVYSYALCCVALALVAGEDGYVRRAVWLGVVIGLAAMVRPTNLVLALLLLVLPWPGSTRRLLTGWLGFAAAFVVATLPQTVWWFVSTGAPIAYSYGGEGFDFRSPHLIEFLFSVEKGLYFWHPAYLLLTIAALAGLWVNWRQAGVALLIAGLTYVVSASWHDWAFGGSFGARPAIDTLPLLVAAAALSAGAWKLGPSLRRVIVGLGMLLITVNLVQQWGYIIGGIPEKHSTWASYLDFWHTLASAF